MLLPVSAGLLARDGESTLCVGCGEGARRGLRLTGSGRQQRVRAPKHPRLMTAQLWCLPPAPRVTILGKQLSPMGKGTGSAPWESLVCALRVAGARVFCGEHGAAAASRARGRGREWCGSPKERHGSPRERHAALGPVAPQCQDLGPFLTSRQTRLRRSPPKLPQAGRERRVSACLSGRGVWHQQSLPQGLCRFSGQPG